MTRVNVGKVAPIPKGVWSSTSTYEKLNMVNKSGILYIAKDNVPAGTDVSTTTYWMKASGNLSIGSITTVSATTLADATITEGTDGQILNLRIPRGVSGNETIDDNKTIDAYDYVWSATKTYNKFNEKADAITTTATGSLVTITDAASAPVADLTVGIEPVQAGSGDPSPSNVRPISGWTEIQIQRTGKNLIHCTGLRTNRGVTAEENSDGSITVSGTPTTTYAEVMIAKSQPLKRGTYTLSIDAPVAFNTIVRVFFPDGTNQNISIPAGQKSATDTIGKDVTSWRMYISGMTAETAVSGTFFLQLEPGSAATSYEPNTETIYTVSWQSAAGTVYGGNFNVKTGILTVDRVFYTAVTSNIKRNSATSYYIAKTNLPEPPLNDINKCLSNKFVASDNTTRLGIYFINSSGNLRFNTLSEYESVSAMVADYGEMTFVYSIEPVTYQLTPTEVTTILGINNIWADTGDVEVTYKADTKLYIDQKIAESQRTTRNLIAGIETDMIATKNYVIGDLLIVGDILYKVTANIAIGSTINTETNVIATTVVEQLILLAQT